MLKKIVFGFFIVVAFGGSLFYYTSNQALIVNHTGEGRLGDHIMGYSKAKLLAFKYNVPFALVPFENAHYFVLSYGNTYKNALKRIFYKIFGKKVWVNDENELSKALKKITRPTRFVIHQLTRLNEHNATNIVRDFHANAWATSILYEYTILYPEFGKQLRAMLQPIVPVTFVTPPPGQISVAVHLRKGGGYDPLLLSQQYYETNPNLVTYKQFIVNDCSQNDLYESIPNCSTSLNLSFADVVWPDKFPPEQYYADQIKNLSNFFDNVPLYVYVFTDDQNPSILTRRLASAVRKNNITFDCRSIGDTSILDDWYSMAHFDCLIRSGSHFAYTNQCIGNHKIIVYPLHLKWIDHKTLVVDRVGVTLREKNICNKKFGL